MSDDRVEVLGKWSVKFQKWTWEYVFSADGTVTWRDPLNNENGKGRWAKTGNLINITWYGSTTKESWWCPITPPDVSGWYQSSYGVGPSRAKKTPDPPPAPAGVPVSPGIANIPWERYLDQFVTCKYDMNYRIPTDKSFAYSSILSLTYGDGVALEIDFESEFVERNLSSWEARDAMAQGYLGRGGRIFPRIVAPATTPRLWSERADALALQEEDAKLFCSISVAAVAFILSVPAMPAGALISSPGKVARQRVPGVAAGRIGPRMVSSLQRAGKRVVVNIGGTGEVADAINLNNQAVPRKDIAALIQRDAAEIGEVFNANTIEEITSNRLPPNTFDWNRLIPGAYKVLKPGGSITIRFQGVGNDAATILK
jgi:hypothetical protein